MFLSDMHKALLISIIILLFKIIFEVDEDAFRYSNWLLNIHTLTSIKD